MEYTYDSTSQDDLVETIIKLMNEASSVIRRIKEISSKYCPDYPKPPSGNMESYDTCPKLSTAYKVADALGLEVYDIWPHKRKKRKKRS